MKLTEPIRLPQGLADRLERWTSPAPPALAVEFAAGRLTAARAGAPPASAPLPPGLVAPSAVAPNLADPDSLAARLRTLLDSVGGATAAQGVALLVPDLTARLALLDFDSLPARRDELDALARLRLRKTLPFPEDKATFSCQALSSTRLLVAYADRSRLDEYEDCLQAAGASAATLLPSGLAAAAALPLLDHRALLLRAEPGSLTTAFCWHGRLEFFRALAVPADATLDDAFPSVAFFRDRVEAESADDRPVLFAAGAGDDLVARLRDEAPWADLRLADRPADLAVTGALRAPGNAALRAPGNAALRPPSRGRAT